MISDFCFPRDFKEHFKIVKENIFIMYVEDVKLPWTLMYLLDCGDIYSWTFILLSWNYDYMPPLNNNNMTVSHSI